MPIVAKFGGTSLANASQIKKVLQIVKSGKDRTMIVVSAPGKRYAGDQKITDVLYKWHKSAKSNLPCGHLRQFVAERFLEIRDGLGLSVDIDGELEKIVRAVADGASSDYLVSRGEYLSAKLVAQALGYEFVDPAGFICLSADGTYCPQNGELSSALRGKRAVIAGFYGALSDGTIKTFSRGGSDITGAIVSSFVSASLYENWTDVSGLLMADPRIVRGPKTINRLTYAELRELAYMGAEVFHAEAIFPVLDARIPILILNTNRPSDKGTRIMPDDILHRDAGKISGIAGRKNFTAIKVEKRLMNREIGFCRRILSVIEENGISYEHMPGGIDTVSVVIDDGQLGNKTESVVRGIERACSPSRIEVQRHIALIAVVGRGMIRTVGVGARVLCSLASSGINVKMINQGSSEISIIIGVENKDYENAVRAIYLNLVQRKV